MLMRWIVGNPANSTRSSVIWNVVGGMFNAGQAAIILIFVSYKLGLTVAGMLTIAYAVANLFLSICKYGVRNFQVTDSKEKFSFADYVWSRYLSALLTIIMLCIYLIYKSFLSGYSVEKNLVIVEVVILKLIDAIEDVYIGRCQQIGRFDIGAKIMAVRLMLSTALMCVLVLCGAGIHFSLLGGVLFSVIMDVYFIRGTLGAVNVVTLSGRRDRVSELLKVCFPLCVGITLSIYIGNVPKYIIDAYMSEEIQAIFGYLMMPVFVITLLNQFIYQPMVKGLGDLWDKGDVLGFKRSVVRQCMTVAILSAVVILGGLFCGLPMLSLLYHVDLSFYRSEFTVLLLGGGFYALAYYLNVPITTIRKQNFIAYGYGTAAVLSFVSGKYFVLAGGMLGAAVLYLSINAFLVVVYAFILLWGLRKQSG